MGKLSDTVFLVDDDARVLKALARLLSSDGWITRPYRSAREFLAEHDAAAPGCLILDLLMPEMTGLDLQQELALLGEHRPIIFLSGRGDVPSSVTAMQQAIAAAGTPPPASDAAADRAIALAQAYWATQKFRVDLY